MLTCSLFLVIFKKHIYLYVKIILSITKIEKEGVRVAYYGNKSDREVKEAYKNSDSGWERTTIEREMNSRGYERSGWSGWTEKSSEETEEYEDTEDTGPSLLLILFSPEFWKCIGILVVAFFAYELISYPMNYYFNMASKYFPMNYYMEGAIVLNKFEMNMLGFMIASGITMVLFKFGTTIRKYVALLFVGIALYTFVSEVKETNPSLLAILLASIVFVIAIFGVFKMKKSRHLGLWMIISTTIGFIVIGNGIIKPWVFLETAGFLLLFMKGNVFVRKQKVHTK